MTLKRCAYLVMPDEGDFVTDYSLGIKPMEDLGWQIELMSWRDKVADWDSFDIVYICTPWDYPSDPAGFMATLEAIDKSSAILVNDIALVKWTLSKTYLRDLESRGVNIVPSLWRDDFVAAELASYFAHFGVDRIIIKPIVSTNATDTFLLDSPVPKATINVLQKKFLRRGFVVQPFIENVRSEGEFSLFFLGGQYSHTILKTPRQGDFRVQEEHGADIISVEPEVALLKAAGDDFAKVEPMPVYGRFDYVRGPDGRFLLMEMEIIEPSLYLRMDAAAPARFAAAIDAYAKLQANPNL